MGIFQPQHWQLALRNLQRNRRRTLLTGLIIALSTAALILTDAFVVGFTDATVRSATRMFPGDAQIHHVDYLAERDEAFFLPSPEPLLASLARESSVANATPRALAFGMISSAADNRAVQVIGIAPDAEARVSRLADVMVDGEYLADSGPVGQLLMGRRLAVLLEVGLGDRLVVSVHNQEYNSADQQLFRVSGLFHFNAKGFDEEAIFILLPRLQNMMAIGDGVHEVAFNMQNASLASDPDLPLWQQLSGPDVRAEGWTTLMPQLASMLALTGSSMAVIGVILFILAGLGVTNGIFMSIYERTWEIGVLLAVGTRRRGVFALIMAETLLLALGAVLVGMLMGWGGTLWLGAVGIDYGSMEISGVAVAEVIRAEVQATQYTVFPVAVVALTLVAALYPALYAARILPAKALHKSL